MVTISHFHHLEPAHKCEKPLVLTSPLRANVRLGWKGLNLRKPLAYWATKMVTTIKVVWHRALRDNPLVKFLNYFKPFVIWSTSEFKTNIVFL